MSSFPAEQGISQELFAAQESLRRAVFATDTVWGYLGFDHVIDEQRYVVLPDDQYKTHVISLLQKDYHESQNLMEIPEQVAFSSGAIVIPGAEKIYIKQQSVETLTDTEGKHPILRLAATASHEWIHHLTLQYARQMEDPADYIDARYGEGAYDRIMKGCSSYPDISFMRVGPAMEIRSQGKLRGTFSLEAVEFLADLAKYTVLLDSPGSPYSVRDVAEYIMYPGGLEGDSYNELAHVRNGERQMISLFALLVSQSLSYTQLGTFMRNGIRDGFNLGDHSFSSDLDTDILKRLVSILCKGGKDSETASVLNALLTQAHVSCQLREASKWIRGGDE